MKERPAHLQITATCPDTGRIVPTHAWMTARQISRFRGQLVFFCSACRQTHLLRGDELRLVDGGAAAQASGVATPQALGRRTTLALAATARLARHVARVKAAANPDGERLERA